MSTKGTIWRGDEPDQDPGLHLYEEMTGNTVDLRIRTGAICFSITLPPEMLRAIRNSEACMDYAAYGTTDPDPSSEVKP